MLDITKTVQAKSDQLNACDLIGGALTIIITDVKLASGDQPLSIYYEDDNGKPFKPCKSMRRVLLKAWGKDGNKFVGCSMTLFCKDEVKWAGQEVGGIRISHMSDIDKDFSVVLAESRQIRKSYKVKKIVVEAVEPTITQAEINTLIEYGTEASQKGVEDYTVWGKSLTIDEKTAVKGKLKEWLDIAKVVDIKVPEIETDDEFPV